MAVTEDEEFLQLMDTQPLTFGKHNGETPEEVCKTDPGYIKWVREAVKPLVVSHQLYLIACEMEAMRPKYGGNKMFWSDSRSYFENDDVPF